jgi:hypothetical protein
MVNFLSNIVDWVKFFSVASLWTGHPSTFLQHLLLTSNLFSNFPIAGPASATLIMEDCPGRNAAEIMANAASASPQPLHPPRSAFLETITGGAKNGKGKSPDVFHVWGRLNIRYEYRTYLCTNMYRICL